MQKLNLKSKLEFVLISAAVFFIAAYPFKKLYSMVPGITEIRPANMAAPVLGLVFGIYGAIGTAIGNLASDLAAGSDMKTCILGIAVNLFYSYAPYVLWHAYSREVQPPLLKNIKDIIRYILIMLLVSAAASAMLSLYIICTFGGSFTENFVMITFNNFDFAAVLGVPCLFVMGRNKMLYVLPQKSHPLHFSLHSDTKLYKNTKSKPTLQNEFLLWFLSAAVIYIIFIAALTYEMCGGMSFRGRWSKILTVTGISAHIVFIISLAFLGYTEKTLIKPIEQLAETSEEFALQCRNGASVTAVPISVHGENEIAKLAESFGFMMTEITKYMYELEKTTAEKEYFKAELDIASEIQSGFLPENCSFTFGSSKAEIFAYMKTAKEVGGDTYDFFMTDSDHAAVLIADASGKGISAAMFISASRQMIKASLASGRSPSKALTDVNRQLCKENSANMFITAWLGIFEIDTGRLEYANAAHNPPVVIQNGRCRYLNSPPHFFLAGFEDTVYTDECIYLEKGDTLFLYTDGIVEALDTENNLYGENRLLDALNENVMLSLENTARNILDSVNSFCGKAVQSDDMTMLLIRAEFSDSITLSSDISSMQAITSFVKTALTRMGCPSDRQTYFLIALDEIAANIRAYAYPDDPNGTITVKCFSDEERGRYSLIISDCGLPFDPLNEPKAKITGSAHERNIGGLGIHIVRNLMDDAEYEYTGGKNVLTLSLNKAAD
jgi:sigma-B regulation protein RsbU (phosphoserine phosphatase)